jgi:hypothetical protein
MVNKASTTRIITTAIVLLLIGGLWFSFGRNEEKDDTSTNKDATIMENKTVEVLRLNCF